MKKLIVKNNFNETSRNGGLVEVITKSAKKMCVLTSFVLHYNPKINVGKITGEKNTSLFTCEVAHSFFPTVYLTAVIFVTVWAVFVYAVFCESLNLFSKCSLILKAVVLLHKQ